MSGKQRLFLVIFISCVISLLLVYFTKGVLATIIIAISIFVLLLITKNIWLPENYGKAMVRRYSLYIIFTVTTVFSVGNHFLQLFQEKLFSTLTAYFPFLGENFNFESQNMIIIFLFVLIGIFIVNFFMRDTTAIGQHSNLIEKEFPEKEYKQRLKLFCDVLYDDLNRIDRETNWSSDQFTPLDAEVEIRTNNKKKRRISDLLTALKANKKSKVFLILGDPGAGKSVSLRKLAKDLLKEVNKSGKIPIYVNLKEWDNRDGWTEDKPPSSRQLYDFVVNNLKDRLDVFANEFIDIYFKKMFDNGRLFIILDSFDEIPSLLDVDESSWLIDELSHTIYQFLAGAHESRGILSSRIFRKPTQNFQAQSVLEIRQLTDLKIKEVFKKSLYYNEKITTTLFKERQELVPLAKNPFIAALILSYAKENNNKLPINQSDLYANYLNSRLKSAKEKIKKKSLTTERILQAAKDIAYEMFSSSSGLEISVEQLVKSHKEYPIEDILDVLTFCRIGRIGSTDDKRFSFVHRRFNEYFVAKKMLETNDIPIDSIPTDSRFRDALVLYCEVAPERTAKKIADYCWLEIEKMSHGNLSFTDPQYLRSIHCLRFLKDAFRSRTSCIANFENELNEFILNQIEKSENIIYLKQSIEVVGLLRSEDVDNIVTKAFQIENEWINETALRSCRHLPRLTKDLENNIVSFLFNMNLIKFFLRRKEISFSLSFSDGFSKVKKYCSFRVLDSYILIFSTILQCLTHPIILCTLILTYFIFIFLIDNLFIDSFKFIYKLTKADKERLNNLGVLKIKLLSFLRSPAIYRMMGVVMYITLLFSNLTGSGREFLYVGLFSLSSFSLYIEILLVITLVPWVELVVFSKKLKKIPVKKLLLLIVVIFFQLVFLFLVYKFERLIPDFIKEIMYKTIAVIPFLYIPISISIYYKNYISDKKTIKKFPKGNTISREEISSTLMQLRTYKGKLAYVKTLEDKKVKFIGEWTNEKLFLTTNDGPDSAAYVQLAKLEEKMLGLD